MFVPPPKPAKVARQTEDQDEAEADEAEKKRIAERGAKFEDIKGNCRDCGEELPRLRRARLLRRQGLH